MSRVWIGASGYVYDHWRDGVFYPPGLPPREWLTFYSAHFSSVEINVTFYRLAHKDEVREWAARTPPGFQFFIKGSRFITHMKRLKDADAPLQKFLAPLRPLGEKLAGVLWQFPPHFKRNRERLADFLALFRKRSDVRLAFEFRNPEWYEPEIETLLREHAAVFCRADAPEFLAALKLPETAKYRYYRRHGAVYGGAVDGGYPLPALRALARELRAAAAHDVRECFVYFNNDLGGHAIRDAVNLERVYQK